MEQRHVGVKILKHAELMSHGDYANEKYGPTNPIHTKEFSIQSKDAMGYKVVYEDGYVSWSPKEVFEKVYIKIPNTSKVTQADYRKIINHALECEDKTEFSFGTALEACVEGYSITRAIMWNNAKKFIYYVPGGLYKTQTEVAKRKFGSEVLYQPYFAIRTITGTVSIYTPTQEDMMANDWQIQW